MIGKFFKNKLGNYSQEQHKKELLPFLEKLDDGDDDDVGMIVAIGTILRMQINCKNGLLQDVLDSGYKAPHDKLAEILLNMSSLTIDLQKDGRTRDAVGVAVWVHTLRCFAHPEFIDYGKNIWSELSRGFDFIGIALDNLETVTGNSIPNKQAIIENAKYIPIDFEV
jgi:hypothetical protein